MRAGQLVCRGRRLTVSMLGGQERRCEPQAAPLRQNNKRLVQANKQTGVSTDHNLQSTVVRRISTDNNTIQADNRRKLITDGAVQTGNLQPCKAIPGNNRAGQALPTGYRTTLAGAGCGRSAAQYSCSDHINQPTTSPVYYRHFPSHARHGPPPAATSPLSQWPPVHPNSSPVPSTSYSGSRTQPHLISYPCSSYQPLPLVFPIYHMDKFYMSLTPLVPGYCIQPTTSV